MPEYGKLKVTELKEELGKRGLPRVGLKAELVKRLVEADAQSENARNATDGAHEPDVGKEEESKNGVTVSHASEAAKPAINGTQTQDTKEPSITDPVAVITGGEITAASTEAKVETSANQAPSQKSHQDPFKPVQDPSETDADSTVLPGNLTQPGTAQTSESTQLPVSQSATSARSPHNIYTRLYHHRRDNRRLEEKKEEEPEPTTFLCSSQREKGQS